MSATSNAVGSERVFLFEVDRAARQLETSESGDGLQQLLTYLEEHDETSSLIPLDGSKGQSIVARATRVGDLSGLYLFRATSKEDSHTFAKLLGGHARVPHVYRPPTYRAPRADKPIARAKAVAVRAPAAPLTAAIAEKLAEADRVQQWGLERCGFRHAWHALEGDNPGPIVMIDNGSHLRHRELEGVIDYTGPAHQESIADHSSSVAAIMCALRGEPRPPESQDMDGCCPARIEMFNIWTKHQGVDHAVLYNALEHAIKNAHPVVNISVWLQEKDDHLERLLKQCDEANVVVVAAIGNTGSGATSFYPATDPHVIAVAATDPADQHQVDSIIGPQAFIAAPGENILTVKGNSDYDRLCGTSFAAPFVSAAVWLAKRKRPGMSNDQVRWLLSRSVENPGQARNAKVGYGRLDMTQLVLQLPNVPDSDECGRILGEDLDNAEGQGAEVLAV